MNGQIRLFFILLIFLIFSSNFVYSQITLNDTLVINKLIETADSILANEPKNAKVLVDSAVVLSKSIALPKYEAKCLQSRFEVLYYMGKYKNALDVLNTLLTYFQSEKDTLKIATVYNDMGLVYTEMTDYAKALEYLQNAVTLRGNNGGLEEKATTLGNIGLAYIYSNKFEDALFYSNKALKIFDDIQFQEGIATMNSNIGNIYYNLKDYDKALEYYEIALNIYEKESHLEGIARVYNLEGMLFFHWKKYKKSIEYIQKSADIRLKMGHNNGYLYALNNVAYIYNYLGQKRNAVKIFKLALSTADEENDKRVITLLLTNLSKTYSDLGEHKKANEQLQEYIKLNNEIFNTEKSEQIEELKIEFETEQKEAEIKNLKAVTELQNKSLGQRQLIIFLLLGSIALIGLLGYFGISRYRLRAQQNSMKLEQRLLRSQMNPHFIFNSLSVIQGYIFKGSSKEAASYLSNFGKLMRHILENSREEYVMLNKEVETLNHYLELQNLRHGGKINYRIDIGENLSSDSVSVPPMLAQPFIENSIKHGMNDNGEISIIVKYLKNDDKMKLIIEDNGIGINNNQNKNDKLDKHKSLAISITEERLQILSKRSKSKYKLRIININQEDKNRLGTRVEVELPYLEEF